LEKNMIAFDGDDLGFNRGLRSGATELLDAFETGRKMRYLTQPCSPAIELFTDAETVDLRVFISETPSERPMRRNRHPR
jgi:hypothetical protein